MITEKIKPTEKADSALATMTIVTICGVARSGC